MSWQLINEPVANCNRFLRCGLKCLQDVLCRACFDRRVCFSTVSGGQPAAVVACLLHVESRSLASAGLAEKVFLLCVQCFLSCRWF